MKAIELVTTDENGDRFTAATFLSYMRASASHWWDANNGVECPWVFRGHADKDWELRPTAARPNFEGVPEFQRIVEATVHFAEKNSAHWNSLKRFESESTSHISDELWRERIRDQISREWAHMKCVARFVKLARELNFNVDAPPTMQTGIDAWLDDRNRLRDCLELYHILEYPPKGFDFFESHSVALAQHHGVPTFVLDWTENPLTACHFASTNAGERSPKGIAVWCLNTSALPSAASYELLDNEFQLPSARLVSPPTSGNTYLSSQAGIVTYLKSPHKQWLHKGIYPNLEDVFKKFAEPKFTETINSDDWLAENSPYQHSVAELRLQLNSDLTFLKKIVLDGDQVASLKQLLLRERVSEAHLMPSLDNIASTALSSLLD